MKHFLPTLFLFLILLKPCTSYAQIFKWANSGGGMKTDISTAIAFDNEGSSFITGTISGDANFDNITLKYTGTLVATASTGDFGMPDVTAIILKYN